MKIKRILAATIILFFLIEGIRCDSKTESEFHKQNGLVLYYGSSAVDGCEWIIQIYKVDYSPRWCGFATRSILPFYRLSTTKISSIPFPSSFAASSKNISEKSLINLIKLFFLFAYARQSCF